MRGDEERHAEQKRRKKGKSERENQQEVFQGPIRGGDSGMSLKRNPASQ